MMQIELQLRINSGYILRGANESRGLELFFKKLPPWEDLSLPNALPKSTEPMR